LTRNAVLVEIKTPCTPLLGRPYRGDVYNVSTELSGAVMQVRNSKDSLLKSCHALKGESAASFEAYDPPSMVIVGDTGELTDSRSLSEYCLRPMTVEIMPRPVPNRLRPASRVA
jgi:hypothetical protein